AQPTGLWRCAAFARGFIHGGKHTSPRCIRDVTEPPPDVPAGTPCGSPRRPYTGGVSNLVVPGGALASTGVAKSPGACRGGSFPRKSSCKTLVANDDNYALAA